jgi:ParB family transcriptional regulator, chromosome partitioning protein
MEIVKKAIKDLLPYEFNPKDHPAEQVTRIVKSITDFGFLVPMVITEKNEIVAGHGRLLAAKQLKLTEVPCVLADNLTEDQIRAFRIADNKVAESEWILDILGKELADLAVLKDVSTGFDADEIVDILNASSASSFLDDIIGEFGSSDDHIGGRVGDIIEGNTTEGLVKISFACSVEQRNIIMEAVKLSKAKGDFQLSTDALVDIAVHYTKESKKVTNGKKKK